MAENKTQKTTASVEDFLAQIADTQKQADSKALCIMMETATGAPARMWGGAIIGFGDYRYQYESGREGDWFVCGFSPRKANLALYLMGGLQQLQPLLEKLGKYKTGKGCLYINKLTDVDEQVLRAMIDLCVKKLKDS